MGCYLRLVAGNKLKIGKGKLRFLEDMTFVRLKWDLDRSHGNMIDWKQALNLDFSWFTQNPVMILSHNSFVQNIFWGLSAISTGFLPNFVKFLGVDLKILSIICIAYESEQHKCSHITDSTYIPKYAGAALI